MSSVTEKSPENHRKVAGKSAGDGSPGFRVRGHGLGPGRVSGLGSLGRVSGLGLMVHGVPVTG